MPSPRSNVTFLINLFHKLNLSILNLISLSSFHSISMGRCFSIIFRLYNQFDIGRPDPYMDPRVQFKLNYLCLVSGYGNIARRLEATPSKFDNQYFKDLRMQRVFLNLDETLFSCDAKILDVVKRYSVDLKAFLVYFVEGMIKLGDLQIIQPSEFKRNYHSVNNAPREETKEALASFTLEA